MYTISGISPNDIPASIEEIETQLNKLVEIIKNERNNKKIVAIGEIGLDYYWEKNIERRN